MENIEYKGYTIIVQQDVSCESPRDFQENLGKMLCFHKRYTLGDNHDIKSSDFDGWEAVRKHLVKELGAVVIMPLYLYDHSVQSISCGSFIGRAVHAEWDSGQVGFVYATRKAVLENFMVKRLSKKTIEKTVEILKAEVDTYDQYIKGEVYHFRVEDKDGNFVDSCGGFYGDTDYMVKEAKASIDNHIESLNKNLSKILSLG